MKKGLVLAVAATCIMSATTALAAPGEITINGSVDLKYNAVDRPEGGTVDGFNKDASGFSSTIILNSNMNLTTNLDLYARYTYQSLTNRLKPTTFRSYIDDHGYNGAIDAFGLKYSNAGYKYTIGSQALTIGSGLIYDNGFIGKHSLPYAAVVSKKVGATDLTAFYAKTNYQESNDNDKFYGLQGSYAVNDKFTVGGMFTAVKYGNNNPYAAYAHDTSENFFEINGSYQIDPKLGFSAAYAKSNADTDNKAYIGTFNYAFDKKNKLGVSYYRSEDLSDIVDSNWGDMTTTPNANTKGVAVSYSNKINKDLTFSVSRSMYTAINPVSNGGSDSNDRVKTSAGLTYTF